MRPKLYDLVILTSISIVIFLGSLIMAQPPRERISNPARRHPPPQYLLGDVFPMPLLHELELTSDQQRELDAISTDLRLKLEKLLSNEQKQKVECCRPTRSGGSGELPDAREMVGPDGSGRPGRNRSADDLDSPKTYSVNIVQAGQKLPKDVRRVPISFSRGHETDPRDHGRPVVLIAAALGVSPEVFRDAFSGVRPASGGRAPESAQVRLNKAVLMKALEKYGITNDQLDKVSNYYRYPPGPKSLWTCRPAVANALIKDGSIIGYEIVDGGCGYSSVPNISIPNFKGAVADVEIEYGKQLETNGSISAISTLTQNAD